MAEFHLAQLNIAKMRYPLDAPDTADFVARLDTLQRDGPTPRAFTFRQSFDPP